MKVRLSVDDKRPFGYSAMRHVSARRAFLDSDICRFVERNRMKYYTVPEWEMMPVVAVYLDLTEDQYTLLKMKLDDQSRLRIVNA